MEMPVKGFGNCPVEGYNKAVLEANQYKGVHYVKIPSVMSSKPLDDANCEWKEVNPETVGDASATGYFFAQVINKTLDIPVGLVMANKGGSRVESWLDRDYLKKNTKEDLDSAKMTKSPKFKWDFLYPLLWGNGTFHPILNYSVRVFSSIRDVRTWATRTASIPNVLPTSLPSGAETSSRANCHSISYRLHLIIMAT